jgi:hypothetical protein
VKSSSGHTCATCTAFPLKDAADGDGRAICQWFGKSREWNEMFCVIYERDRRDIRTRGKLIEQIIEKEKMNNVKQRPKAGEIWKTARGHRVRILAGASKDVIETAYVDGRVDGNMGANFDADTLHAVRGDDDLVGRA